jgi:hypothetical protein
VSTANVTPEQLATARWVFSTFSAFAVALAGSIAALVYYARNRVPGAPSFLGELIAKTIAAIASRAAEVWLRPGNMTAALPLCSAEQ